MYMKENTNKKVGVELSPLFYYIEDGKYVFTEQYHLNRGYCCGNKCRHCPFNPKHLRKNTNTE